MPTNEQVFAKMKKLYDDQQYMEALTVSNAALESGLFSEDLYDYAFKTLDKLKMYKLVISMYHTAQTEYEKHGVQFPTPLISEIYAKAVDTLGEGTADLLYIKEELHKTAKREKDMTGEPFYCGYEVFKHVYAIMARTAERTGQVISIILLTIVLPEEKRSEESEKVIALRVRDILSSGALRKSDVFTQYSNTKYIIALSTDRAIGASFATKRLELRFAEELEGTGVRVVLTGSEIE